MVNRFRDTVKSVVALTTALGHFAAAGPVLAQGGVVAGAVERTLVKRLAQRGALAALSASERAALARLWGDLDAKTLAQIERRFGAQISKERMAQAAKTPATLFAEREEFEKYLMKLDPAMSEETRKRVLGVYFREQVAADGHQVFLPQTVAHERLHQLSHPRFKQAFGTPLNEGMTEMYTREIHRGFPLNDIRYSHGAKREIVFTPLNRVYEEERRIAMMLAARVPEERLAAAYFRGEIGELRRWMDSDIGRGAFDRFATAMRSNDLKAAEQVLRAPIRKL